MIPSESQALVRLEMESMEVMSAEEVAVWYGIMDSTQKLNSAGSLITQTQRNHCHQSIVNLENKNTEKKTQCNALNM